VREVADLAAAGHYQVACTRHLEARLQRRQNQQQGSADADPGAELNASTAVSAISAITSPNQYFDLCVNSGRPPSGSAQGADTAAILSGAGQQQRPPARSYA
ncbi:hypothetical protein LPJ66_001532, partial [Kickxella alabastrina]